MDLNSKPYSLTHIQNLSFDEANQLAIREIVGVDTNGVIRKVPVGTDGSLQTSNNSLPTVGNNPVIKLHTNASGELVKVEKIIGATTYTKTSDVADQVITLVTTYSAWT
jgi:hypothetical protein